MNGLLADHSPRPCLSLGYDQGSGLVLKLWESRGYWFILAVPFATESCTKSCSFDPHLGLCGYQRDTLQQKPCRVLWLALPLGTMATFWPGMLPRTFSGSLVIPQLGAELISPGHVATKDHTVSPGLGHNLWTCWHARTVPPPSLILFEWTAILLEAIVLSRPGFMLMTKIETMVLLEPGSVLLSIAPETIDDCGDAGAWDAAWGQVVVQGPGDHGAMPIWVLCTAA